MSDKYATVKKAVEIGLNLYDGSMANSKKLILNNQLLDYNCKLKTPTSKEYEDNQCVLEKDLEWLMSGDTKLVISNYYYGGSDWQGDVGFYVVENRGPHEVTYTNGGYRYSPQTDFVFSLPHDSTKRIYCNQLHGSQLLSGSVLYGMGFTGSHTFKTDYLSYCNGTIVKCLISGTVTFTDGTFQSISSEVPPTSITPISTRADGWSIYECYIDLNVGVGPYAVDDNSGFINLGTTKAIKSLQLECYWYGAV